MIKTEYVIHRRNLKQTLNHRLVLQNVHKVIQFNQNVWLKTYIDINTDLRRKSKKWFRKRLLSLSREIMQFLEKLWKLRENIRKNTTERKRNYLVWERKNHTSKLFTENLLAIEMKKNLIKYLRINLSI